MQRFTNILFSPVGGRDNPAAIRRVTDLARRNGARLTLLGIVPEPSRRHRMRSSAVLDAAIESAARQDMTERLERWCEGAEGVDIDIDVQTGNAALTVIGQVFACGHDLVVVTSDEDREDRILTRDRECVKAASQRDQDGSAGLLTVGPERRDRRHDDVGEDLGLPRVAPVVVLSVRSVLAAGRGAAVPAGRRVRGMANGSGNVAGWGHRRSRSAFRPVR